MIAWRRATVPMLCGGCGRHLAVGDPLQVIEIGGVTRRFFRCEGCAGQAPPDLPAEPAVPAPSQGLMERVDQVAQRYLHDREPGEEG